MHSRTCIVASVAALVAFVLLGACASLDGIAGGGEGTDAADAGSDGGSDGSGDTNAPPESDPGLVPCGPSKCSVPAAQCCVSPPPSPGQPLDTRCRPVTDGCPRSVIACDEKADCPGSEYCCVGPSDAGDYRATCERLCGPVQACKTDGECLGGKTCKQQTCLGLRIWACAPSAVCSTN